jgi:hypothetical protein
MSIPIFFAIGSLLGCGLFALKDWGTIELDLEKKKLTIQRRTNLLPPAN